MANNNVNNVGLLAEIKQKRMQEDEIVSFIFLLFLSHANNLYCGPIYFIYGWMDGLSH